MKRNRTLRIWGGFLLLLLLLFTFLIWNIFAGSVSLSASEIWRILLEGDVGFTQSQIIVKIRLPRLLSALILGGALSLSGYLLQTFFHNPIAGPFVLGISSGAKMTVCVAMLALLSRGKTTSSAILIAAAFAGAMVSMGFVLLISPAGQAHEPAGGLRRDDRLYLLGTDGFSRDLCRRFQHRESAQLVSRLLLRHELGQRKDYGRCLRHHAAADLPAFQAHPGVPVGRGLCPEYGRPLRAFRTALILLSSVLSACVTAFAGPISFVGIAVPHLMKSLVQIGGAAVYDPSLLPGRRRVLPVLRPRRPHRLLPPTEVSISSVTAVFGAPIVIYMMIHRKAA